MFILLLVGEGEGCDYTIGCNKTWKFLKATDVESAKKEAACTVLNYSEPEIEKALLINYTESNSINVTSIKNKFEEKERKLEEQRQLDAKKELFEKLKVELGEA